MTVCSDTAKNTLTQLKVAEVPAFEDNEKSFPELYARIEKTVDLLKAVKPEAFEGKETFTVVRKAGPRVLHISGLVYLQAHAVPNFFFHCTTAYDILRMNGVPVGKADFLGVERI